MKCQEASSLLDAYADGELDAAGDREIESHLHACAECTKALEEQRALAAALGEGALRFRAPPDLRASILRSLTVEADAERREGVNSSPVLVSVASAPLAGADPTTQPARPQVSRMIRLPVRWTAFAAAAAVFVCGVLVGGVGFAAYSRRAQSTDFLVREIVSGHVRSLLTGNHLTDVLSSDRHTVKPWFEGKLDFSPPVVDLAANGFPLAGGRLDYLAGRPVASLVYRRDKHVINLFVWPLGVAGGAGSGSSESTRQGYHLRRWTGAGMNWWAVSDLNESELTEFVGLLQSSSLSGDDRRVDQPNATPR